MTTQAVAELNLAIAGLSEIARTIADEGSDAARQAILTTVMQHRGTLSVSGLGATLDVLTSTRLATDTASEAAVRAVPANAWGLVDKGARPHTERRRRGMPAAPYGIFSKVNHPGTAGLNVAPTARAAADQAVTAVAQGALDALPRH